jgi:hypothetical protein
MLTYRQASADGYRVTFDGVEVGSVSKRTRVGKPDVWHWGVDTMPLMDHGGRPPSGDAETFETALAAFKDGFARWHAGVDPALWKRNRDYKAAGDRWN